MSQCIDAERIVRDKFTALIGDTQRLLNRLTEACDNRYGDLHLKQVDPAHIEELGHVTRCLRDALIVFPSHYPRPRR